jgi:hypothetical protein
MNREELIRMAREAGAAPYTNRHYPDRTTHTFSPNQLERFAALVAAAERDAMLHLALLHGAPWHFQEAIRARGQA